MFAHWSSEHFHLSRRVLPHSIKQATGCVVLSGTRSHIWRMSSIRTRVPNSVSTGSMQTSFEMTIHSSVLLLVFSVAFDPHHHVCNTSLLRLPHPAFLKWPTYKAGARKHLASRKSAKGRLNLTNDKVQDSSIILPWCTRFASRSKPASTDRANVFLLPAHQ